MKQLAEKILTDKAARQEVPMNGLAVQLATAFSPWAYAPAE